MKLRLPRWLATLPLSLVIHLAIVAAVIALLRAELTLPPLVIDLTAVIAGRDDGPGAEGERSPGPARAAARAKPHASAPARAEPPRRDPPAPPPSPVPRAPEPMPAPSPSRAEESTPAPPRDVASSSPSVPASSGGVAETAPTRVDEGGGRSAGQASGDPAASGGTPASTGGAGGSNGRAVGAGSGERVAAIPGTGTGAGSAVGAEYAGYYARIRQRIQEALRYPAVAKRRELAGTVQLEINIAADGAFSAVSVIGSSSHEMLDRAAVEAARSVRRIPFPAGVPGRPLTVRLPVVFELQ